MGSNEVPTIDYHQYDNNQTTAVTNTTKKNLQNSRIDSLYNFSKKERPEIIVSNASNNNSPMTMPKHLNEHQQQSVVQVVDKPTVVSCNDINDNNVVAQHNQQHIYDGLKHYLDGNSNSVQHSTLSASDSASQHPYQRHSSLNSMSSNCSSFDLTSDYSDENDDAVEEAPHDGSLKTSMWVKLRKAVRWSPFMQSYKKKDYRWIQLAGHSGGFKAGENGTIMKKSSKREMECLQKLMKDPLKAYVPEFKRHVMEDEDLFLEMQDLLQEFDHPAFVMDCKIGTRTYLGEEVKKNPKPREDLYMKMISVDQSEATAAENETCSCTKERYMQWREQLSSTASLGFRIEGIKRGENNPDKDFKKLKSEEDISCVFGRFVENKKEIRAKYVQRLKDIRKTLISSNFFKSHELIGSSLLFIHDTKGRVGIWLIDFGKTVGLANGVTIDHKSPWLLGNHEDGYLTGLDNLIKLWSGLDCSKS